MANRVSSYTVAGVCLSIAIILVVSGCGGISSGDPSPTPTPPGVTPSGYLTWKFDNQRTGLQPNETILTPANVNAAQFGEKFSVGVDGWVYAQPLYVPGVTIAGV